MSPVWISHLAERSGRPGIALRYDESAELLDRLLSPGAQPAAQPTARPNA
jgi:hypothetical protein